MSALTLLDILSEDQVKAALANTPLAAYIEPICNTMSGHDLVHGTYPKWRGGVEALPTAKTIKAYNDEGHWRIDLQELPEQDQIQLEAALKQLMPWRKGPYKIGPIKLDTEWRSDWKWNRLINHITPLKDKLVLDVGCGNGYHLWRMHEAGASLALGVEPSPLFNMQYQAIQHYANIPTVAMLPLTFEQFPATHAFDTVFSMGVLYHRREPHEHLQQLRNALKAGGELVLETLVAPGEDDNVMPIEDRYANMRNLYELPTVLRVASYLNDAGFSNVRCVSTDITSVLEQRTTEWMTQHSLFNAISQEDKALTVEGLPRPRRAILIADAPE